MAMLLLEMLLVLGLAVFIVWWVVFAGRRPPRDEDEPPK